MRRLLRSLFGGSKRPDDEPAAAVVEPPPSEPPAAEPPPAEPVETPPVDPDIRPLEPRIGNALEGVAVTPASLAEMMAGPVADELSAYFHDYPPTSLMGGRSRALLFALVRTQRPATAAEVGTFHGGGAEVITRALWENGEGFLHTTDPFGAERCPEIFARWPGELRRLVEFHPLNSMDFFLKLHHRRVALDFVLVDGDHDYELALFDLQMAARLLRPGGIVVMNDSVQTGPFQAAKTFLAANPAWRELGTAIASYDENAPFAGGRASQPGTGFAVLQAPSHWSIGAIPRSWGQAPVAAPLVEGLSLEALPQVTSGHLHYQAILRLFGDGPPQEAKRVGVILVKLDGSARTVAHELAQPMRFQASANAIDPKSTFEIELCWQADPGAPPLALASLPSPLPR
ncbi:Methyltransferase domain-containing protein [Rhodospirillales bacterium URHD0017]|nr:Methyltransferase domain-containing protein [Rhodospirillales bacterium URHD0017]